MARLPQAVGCLLFIGAVAKRLRVRHGNTLRLGFVAGRQRSAVGQACLDLPGQVEDPCQHPPAGPPGWGLRIRWSHSSSKAAFRFLRSCTSISGRCFSRTRAENPAAPREITAPATRPTTAETALATPLVVSSSVRLSLVRLATEDMPASAAQPRAPPGALWIRSTRAT